MTFTDNRAETSSESVARRQKAAEWYVQFSESVVTEAQMSQWLAWTHADAKNLKAFENIAALASGLRGLDPEARAVLARELIGRQSAVRMRRTSWHWSPAWFAGLAASVAIAIVVGLYLLSTARNPAISGTYITEKGAAIRNLVLVDGTRVALGPGSILDVEYTPGRRKAVLRAGEAYFQVKHDIHWPFRVRVGRFQISDVGTAFDVQIVNNFISVAVAHGIVNLSLIAPRLGVPSDRSALQPLRLIEGQGVYTKNGTLPAVRSVDNTDVASWRKGLLRFNDVPLSMVFDSVNHYTRLEIVVTGSQLERVHYTGTVYTDHVDEWLTAVERIFNLQTTQVNKNGRIELLVKPRANLNISSKDN